MVTCSATAPLRLGLVGCGRLAEFGYLPAIARLGVVRLAGVVDPVPARRRRLAELAGPSAGRGRPTAFASIGELLASGVAEAVVIASPPAEHPEQAASAAAAGLATLVEKPPATDAYAAAALRDLDPAPRIGFNRRFGAVARLLPRIPRGRLLNVTLELRYRRASWDAYAVRDEALIDIAPHLIDLGLLITSSRPLAVRVARREFERAELELETTRARVLISCAADRPHRESVDVRDGAGRRLAATRSGGLRGHARRLRGGDHPLVASLARQLDAFARSVRGAAEPLLAGADDGLAAMVVVDAARESAARGGLLIPTSTVEGRLAVRGPAPEHRRVATMPRRAERRTAERR